MNFATNNFLLGLTGLQTFGGNGNGKGLGFKKSEPIILQDLCTAAGLTLTAGTSPPIAALETNFIGIQWAAGNAAKVLLNFTVPVDYDQTTDVLNIHLLANSAGNTDAPTISANVYNKRAGTALSADLAPTASAAITKSATAATAASDVFVSIAGKGLLAGDRLTILIFPGTHGTDAVNLYGIELHYWSTLVAFNQASR